MQGCGLTTHIKVTFDLIDLVKILQNCMTIYFIPISSLFSVTTTAILLSLYRKACVAMASPVEDWRILLGQCFTIHSPLLTATSTFGVGRS